MPRRQRIKIRQLPKAMVPQGGRSVAVSGFAGDNGDEISREAARKLVEGSWSLSRALRIRADAVSVPGLLVMDKDEDNPSPVKSGPLYDLIRRPNDWFSMGEILSLVEYDLCTSENGAFLLLDGFVEVDGRERPTQIWRMDPSRVKVVPGTSSDDPDDWYVKGFVYDASDGTSISSVLGKGSAELIDPENVVWIRVSDPFRSHANQTVLRPAYAAAVLIMRAIIRNKTLHESGVTGAGLVKPVKDSMVWTTEQMTDIAAILQDTIVGQPGQNRLGIVNRPDLELVALTEFSPKDMQFTEMIGTMDRAISQATGVPFPLIDPSEVILSNAKQARQILFSNTIVPQLTRIRDALNIQLVDLWFDDIASGVSFDLASVPELADDVQIKWNVDGGKLEAMLDINDRVRRGEVDVDVAREMLVSQVGITKEMAKVFIADPDEPDTGSDDDLRPIEVAKAIAEAVYANMIPADVGQVLVDLVLGEVGIVALRPGPVVAPPPPGEAPVVSTPQGESVAAAPQPQQAQRPSPPSRRLAEEPRYGSRQQDPPSGGIEVRGSLEHQLAWVSAANRAEAIAAAPTAAVNVALEKLRSAASRSKLYGSGDATGLAADVPRHYTKAIETCIAAVYGMYPGNNRGLHGKWVERVAATAEWAVRQTIVDASRGRGSDNVAGRAVEGLAFFAINLETIESTIPAERERGVVPRGWRPLTWITQLDDRVRDTHAEIHGRRSEYDDGESGHAWDVGDGICLWPGFCSTVDEEAGCRCFVV